MPSLALPSFELLYVALSAVVAIGIVIQIVLLRQNKGKLPNSPLFHLLSFFDTVWVILSLVALYFLDFDKFAISVPVVYGIYSFIGFFYAARTITGTHGDMPTSPDDIVFDVRYLNFCQSFGLAFLGLCVLVLLNHFGIIGVLPKATN